jgi:transcriptional regulator with XRE-family HTH domain
MSRNAPAPRRASKITIPERCDPRAKVVFAEMQRQGVTYDELEHRSGVLRSTFKAWRTNNKPGLDTLEAALGALGWSLLPIPAMEHLPDSVREGLKALAAQWENENELLTGLLTTVCRAAVVRHETPAAVVATITPRRRRAREPNPFQRPLFAIEEAAA